MAPFAHSPRGAWACVGGPGSGPGGSERRVRVADSIPMAQGHRGRGGARVGGVGADFGSAPPRAAACASGGLGYREGESRGGARSFCDRRGWVRCAAPPIFRASGAREVALILLSYAQTSKKVRLIARSPRGPLRAAACVMATGAFEFTLTFGLRNAGHLRQLNAQRGFATKYLGTGPPGRAPVLLPCDVGRDPNRSTFEPKQPPLELRRVPPLPASWCAGGSPLPSGSASCCLLQAEHADHGGRCGSFGRSTHRSINGGSHRRLPRRMNGHRPPTGPEKLRAPCCTSPRDRGNTGVTER